ncbi:beta-ketoacyl-[acyl-carrier-protein] synthase family protein [Streptomyces sp. NPDC046215]|uniref:Beta-ketoacyl-ACP synthase II n=1 Tax=Streptomyces stramineus TaxID=173861 RepID=A0ABP3J868_9ACTN
MSGPRDGYGRWRVAVTGVGLVCPAGRDTGALWRALLGARGTATTVTDFDTGGLTVRFACRVRGFDAGARLPAKTVRRTDPFAQYAACAALDALANARVRERGDDGGAVLCGVGGAGDHTWSAQSRALHEQGPAAVDRLTWPRALPYAAASLIARLAGRTGPCMTVSTACASGTTAIGEGTRLIRDGTCTTVLAGGTEAPVTRLSMAAFARTGALSTRNDAPERACRPFDRHRDGYVLGEGAAFVHLERLAAARARGATVLAEVAGYAQTCDAHHLTAPRPDGAVAAACITAALDDARLAPAGIRQVNAHGTGTVLNDRAETAALLRAFAGTPPPVTAPKGVLGHLMGAAGAVEAVAAALSAEHGLAPPVANYETPDPRCRLDVVSGEPREVGRGPVLSNSFGFGGHNACLVLAPPP